MTRFMLLAVLLPSVALAKGPTFADLLTGLEYDSQAVAPGGALSVVATVDVDAFCARAMPESLELCNLQATGSLSRPVLTWKRDGHEPVGAQDEDNWIDVTLQQGADGLWRGSVTLNSNQQTGDYSPFRVYTFALLPLPSLAVTRVPVQELCVQPLTTGT